VENALVPRFSPHRSEAPTSPDESSSRMGEDSPSPVLTVVSYPSHSAYDGEPTTLESLKEEPNALTNQNKSLADCYQYL